MKSTRSTVFLVVIALAAAAGGAMLARHLGQGPAVALQGGTLFPERRAIADFQLVDHEGHAFGNAELRGRPSLLFFGFTHCPDVCPTTLSILAGLEKRAPIAGLRTLFVTVDPQRDDPLTLKRYVGAFGPSLIGLRGEDAQLDRLMKSLSAVRFVQKTPDGSYSVDHSSTLYLIDGKGRLAAVFTPPFSVTALESDLRLVARTLEH
jgi:protein SCO1/2